MKKRRGQKKEVRAIPLPEAIDGKRWEIHQSHQARTAGVTAQGEHMVVPMGDNQLERLVRVHEMTHVSISPRDQLNDILAEHVVDEGILNLCEDARVHSQMARLGFPIYGMRGVLPDKEINEMAYDSHPATLAALAASMVGTGEGNRLWDRVLVGKDEERHHIYQYGAALATHWIHEQPELPPFETAVEMAKEIQKYLGDPDEPPPPSPPVPPEMLPSLAPKPDPTREIPVEMDPKSRKRPIQNAGKGPWKRMEFEEPPRPLKFPAKMKGRNKRRPGVRGRRLHRIGRLYTDGYVFADRPPLKGGGAILIDTSGSMSLTPDEVLMLCVAYPGGVIASYSSYESVGYLRIIAKNGKRVPDSMLSPPGAGNGVDGPALDWLATQRGPRFWISDAGVEGGARGLRYCLEICRRFNITRVDDAWEIVGKEFDE